MGKAVLISIQPKWCKRIVSGQKTVEIRKTRPKLETPFKCYIYCTYGEGLIERSDPCMPNFLIGQKVTKEKTWGNCCNGKVIGEFVCDDCSALCKHHIPYIEQYGMLPKEKLFEYLGISENQDLPFDYMGYYGWHISGLVIYARPKELSEFKPWDRECLYGDLGLAIPKCENCHDCKVKKPPQSWCYVEELEGGASE